jgi:hypothetical protein
MGKAHRLLKIYHKYLHGKNGNMLKKATDAYIKMIKDT